MGAICGSIGTLRAYVGVPLPVARDETDEPGEEDCAKNRDHDGVDQSSLTGEADKTHDEAADQCTTTPTTMSIRVP